ncbi:MAG: ribosome recycling factor [Myxococcales bacterium]|nr:ribosome recycling factor [Myxococcales bacterium]
MDEIYDELKLSFESTFDALRRDLSRVRSGRANPNILDNIRVPYYGQPTPLNQVANIQAPEARMLTVKPFEQSLLKDIERAILQSDLGLNPNNDGQIIRLAVPPLTEERRQKLVKQVHDNGETAKIAIRNARRKANKDLETMEKDSTISEDESKRGQKEVQRLTDDAITEVDRIISAKDADLMDI